MIRFTIRRLCSFAILASATAVVASPVAIQAATVPKVAKAPADLRTKLVGTWGNSGDDNGQKVTQTFVFDEWGRFVLTVTVGEQSITIKGTWRFVEDDVIEFTNSAGDVSKAQVIIDNDSELTITDGGSTMVLYRATK